MKERVHLSSWRSPEAEQRFRAMEDELAADLITERPSAVDVPTRLGPTRVYRWDGDDRDPVVFLHGASGTGLTWAPFAERRNGRAVYAVDTIGDVGRSRQERPVEGGCDLADWLAEALAAVDVARPHLAGTSYGGFLALLLVAHHPGLARSLFLVEPCGIEPLRVLRFVLWGGSSMLASRLPGPLRRGAGRRLRMPLLDDKRLLRAGLYGQLHHRSRLLPPAPLTDEQLSTIDVPVCLLLGEKSEVFRTPDVRARAVALLPQVTAEVVEGAGHAVSLSYFDLVAERLDTFLRV